MADSKRYLRVVPLVLALAGWLLMLVGPVSAQGEQGAATPVDHESPVDGRLAGADLFTEGGGALEVELASFSDEGYTVTRFHDGRFEIRVVSDEQAEYVRRLFAHQLPPSVVMVVGDLGLDLPDHPPASVHDLSEDEFAEAVDTFIRVGQNLLYGSFGVPSFADSGELNIISVTSEEHTAVARQLFGPDVQVTIGVIDGLFPDALRPGAAGSPGLSDWIPPLPAVIAMGAVLLVGVARWRLQSAKARHTRAS